MNAIDIATPRIKINEGFRANVYIDSTGHRSLGFGFNIDAGITETAAEALLRAQIADIATAVAQYWWAAGLDDPRMSVVVEVAFNDGLVGLLHFPKMLAAIGAKDWSAARAELLDSDAARELPDRYERLAMILFSGIA